MNRFTKAMRTIHRILGIVLGILFLMWFLSGIVMIYHTFPRVSNDDRLAHMNPITTDSLPSIQELQEKLPQGETIQSLTLNNYLGQNIFHVRTDKGEHDIPATESDSILANNWNYVERVAATWCNAPIQRVDSLYELEQWIPFGRLKQDFPIYKFYFADADKHQLYISSRTGNVLQFTTRQSRMWAWLGAIPHWVYFTWLRQDVELWSDVVIALSGVGCLMCLAGLYLGIWNFRIARKRNKGLTTYKHPLFRWHHIVGTIFGIIVITFAFSGMMSLVSMHDIGIDPKLEYSPMQNLRAMAPTAEEYTLDYRQALQQEHQQTVQIEWSNLGDIPYYTLRKANGESIYIDGQKPGAQLLSLEQSQIEATLSKAHNGQAIYKSQLLEDYDAYYISRKHSLPLPVWKIEFDDVDHSCHYVHPYSGQQRYINNPSRLGHWTYQALHTLAFRPLVNHPVIWTIVMWTLLLAGAVISFTGIWMAIRYLVRLFK